ncbi:MAG: protein kinase [Planctomycetota bacterium]
MNCETAQELFLDCVEGELDAPVAAELKAHAASCARCKLGLQQTRDLLGAMGRIKEKEEAASAASAMKRSQSLGRTWRSGRQGGRLGDFEIIREIGRGGMGIVYRARQVSLNRLVALKVLPGIFRQVPTAVTRFLKEAQAAAKLHHTNIVPVYAQGEYEGHCYYAMELIEGDSLDRILRREPGRLHEHPPDASFAGLQSQTGAAAGGRRQSYRFLARLMAGVAEGLDHAHKQGVIHRDIKPQNLLMAGDGQLHITDFGLARLLDEPSITLTGEMVGTPAYMSPEQVTGDRSAIDQRTDIFSFGVTFYEALTGVRPFEGATRDQVTARILTREPKPPRKINPHVPVDLETICLRAMEKEPGRRYPSAEKLAADLRRFADDRPILIRRAGVVERSVKWVRRHPALSTIYGLLIVMTIGAGTWRVQTVKARHARGNELVREAYELLAFEDYREPRVAFAKLAEAGSMGPDEWELRKAMGLANLGEDPKKAIDHLTWVVAQRPADTEPMYLLAWALRIQADRVDAVVKERLAKADGLGGPATAQAHFFRGQVLVREEDEAEKEYRLAKGLKPGYTQALLHLGRALNHWMYHHRSLEKFGELKDSLNAVCLVQDKKAYPRYLLSIGHRLAGEIHQADGKADAAAVELARALELAQDAQRVESDSARGYVAEAEYWETMRNYEKALELRNKSEPYCIKPEPKAELFQYRWRLHFWLGHHEAALKDLETLAALRTDTDPKRVWYLGLFPALVLADQGKVDQAIEKILKTATEKPTSFRAVTAAASFLRMLWKPNEANDLLKQYQNQVVFEPSGRAEVSYGFMHACYRPLNIHHYTEKATTYLTTPEEVRAGRAMMFYLQASDSFSGANHDSAFRLFWVCDDAYDSEDYCYMARVFVRRMELDPAWPQWAGK